jgi:hypothetical protein
VQPQYSQDREGVDARVLDELARLCWVGAGGGCDRGGLVFVASDDSELCLNPCSVRFCDLDGAAGQGDVVVEGQVGAVDHRRCVAMVETAPDFLEVARVVEVNSYGCLGFFGHRDRDLRQDALAGVLRD